MSLIYNGTTIPSSGIIKYNNTQLTKIIYNNTTVWEFVTDTEKECNGSNFTGAQIWRCNSWAHKFWMTNSISHQFTPYFNDNPGYGQVATGLFNKNGYNYCKIVWVCGVADYEELSLQLKLMFGAVTTKKHDSPSNFELFIYDNNLNSTKYGLGQAFPISRANEFVLASKTKVTGKNDIAHFPATWGYVLDLNDTSSYPGINSVNEIEIGVCSSWQKSGRAPSCIAGLQTIKLSTNPISLTTDEINGKTIYAPDDL